jgi:hypothetical protein
MGSGARAVEMVGWIDSRELVFSVHCGTSCVMLQTVDVEEDSYTRLCGSSRFSYWAPGKPWGVVEAWRGGLSLSSRPSGSKTPEEFLECRPLLPNAFETQGEQDHVWNTFDSWSPDRRRFLYTAWNFGSSSDFDLPIITGKPSLGMWDLDTGSGRLLLPDTGLAAWSPDGRRIAAIRLMRAPSDSLTFTMELIIAEAASGRLLGSLLLGSSHFTTPELYQIVEQDLLRPSWAPDGKRLVVVDAARSVVMVDSDAHRLLDLTRGVAAKGVWDPDGRRIALRLGGGFGKYPNARGVEIYLPPSGKEQSSLSAAELIEGYFASALQLARAAGLETTPYSSLEYAKALWSLGKLEEADAQFRNSMAPLLKVGAESTWREDYGRFLRCTGRESEAKKIWPPPDWIPITSVSPLLGRPATAEEVAAAQADLCPENEAPQTSPAGQQWPQVPVVYIVDASLQP